MNRITYRNKSAPVWIRVANHADMPELCALSEPPHNRRVVFSGKKRASSQLADDRSKMGRSQFNTGSSSVVTSFKFYIYYNVKYLLVKVQ